jgi:hypothetical protein
VTSTLNMVLTPTPNKPGIEKLFDAAFPLYFGYFQSHPRISEEAQAGVVSGAFFVAFLALTTFFVSLPVFAFEMIALISTFKVSA